MDYLDKWSAVFTLRHIVSLGGNPVWLKTISNFGYSPSFDLEDVVLESGWLERLLDEHFENNVSIPKSPNNPKKFPFISRIKGLRTIQFSWGKWNLMSSITEILLQYGPHCHIDCVRGGDELTSKIRGRKTGEKSSPAFNLSMLSSSSFDHSYWAFPFVGSVRGRAIWLSSLINLR